jgi:hypothetical protein
MLPSIPRTGTRSNPGVCRRKPPSNHFDSSFAVADLIASRSHSSRAVILSASANHRDRKPHGGFGADPAARPRSGRLVERIVLATTATLEQQHRVSRDQAAGRYDRDLARVRDSRRWRAIANSNLDQVEQRGLVLG